MSWIPASISDALLTHLVNCDTSAQVWNTLEQHFVTQVSQNNSVQDLVAQHKDR